MKNRVFVRTVLFVTGFVILAGFLVKTQSQVKPPDTLTASEKVSRTTFMGLQIVPVGAFQASDAEAQLLLEVLRSSRASDYQTGLPELEQYLATFTNSPWAPSLDAALGKHYFETGRQTLALEHWQLAWEATKNHPSGNGKKMADFALAHWTRLLASLGRYEDLWALINDPLGEAGFEALRGARPSVLRDSANVYAFVANNPVMDYDPLGLKREWGGFSCPFDWFDPKIPRNCQAELATCIARGMIFCGIIEKRTPGPWGYRICMYLYGIACAQEMRECNQWNKDHGF
jgi:hypothetical protein